MCEDSYKTIATASEAIYKEKSSKFLAFAYHVESEQEVRDIVATLKKRYYDATHHCYAWRIGAKGESFRSNDDGEPSGTAGKPILGQLLSHGLTYTLIVVIRYFGGTKLGVSGLISAYKEAAIEVISSSMIETRTEDGYYELLFGYLVMNDVMRVIKEESPRVIEQTFDNNCRIVLAIRRSEEAKVVGRLEDIEGIEVKFTHYK